MVCTHLKRLYQLRESSQLLIGSSDLVRITCKRCDEVETCPSMLMDHYDAYDVQETPRFSESKQQDLGRRTSVG